MKVGHEEDARRNDRWLTAFAAAPLLWCAWWYCRGGDAGLLVVAGVFAAIAVALPRSFPTNARWIIWTWVFVTVAALSANVSRLSPPEDVLGEGNVVDRIVTVAYAIGLSGLFFRLSVLGGTKIMIGCLPMVMRTLGRGGGGEVADAWGQTPVIWGFIVLSIALDHLWQVRESGKTGVFRVTRRDHATRCAWLVAALVLGAVLCQPVRWLAYELQRQIYGLTLRTNMSPSGRAEALRLNQTLPPGFQKRTRSVLLVESESSPRYLREIVYTLYNDGHWMPPKPGQPLSPKKGLKTPANGQQEYRLWQKAAATSGVWRVEVVAPRLFTGICVPGSAVTLVCEGRPPLADTNGMLTASDEWPSRYDIGVTSGSGWESAYPFPDGGDNPEYRSVPFGLRGAVSNWVSACGGFSEAASVEEAAACLEQYFYANFTYRTDVKMSDFPDPLVDFMTRREGFCVHFASAAALMFRSRGIPARVIGGFAGGEWDSWLKRWAVREREGHAWTEVWDALSGRWLLVEATPPGGRSEAVKEPGLFRRVSDLVASGWRRFTYAVAHANILALLAESGTSAIIFLWRAVWRPAGLAIPVAWALFVWWRRRVHRRRQTQDEQVRQDLTRAIIKAMRRMVPEHLQRRQAESWDIWLERIRPELSEESFGTLSKSVEGYERLRYRVRVDRAAARAWLDALRRNNNNVQR